MRRIWMVVAIFGMVVLVAFLIGASLLRPFGGRPFCDRVRRRLERLIRRPSPLAGQSPEPVVEERLPRSSGTILIVEVGGWTCGSLPILLRQVGYGAQVVRGREAVLGVLESVQPTLLIAGGTAGPNFYRALRHVSPAPILALVPEAGEDWVLAAFAAGVDDCQVGPISNREVVARARAILRHIGQASPAAAESSS
jgi:PleD family two-component response regulator